MCGTLTFKTQAQGLEPQWRMRSHRRSRKRSEESKASQNSRENVSRTMAWLTCQILLRRQVRLRGKRKPHTHQGYKSTGLNKKVVNCLGKGSFSRLAGVVARLD